MADQTLYQVLGVEETATAEDIKAAWKRKAKTLHPDVSQEDATAFNRAKHAYDTLSDPERRQRYDETGDSREHRRVPNKERAMVLVLLTQIIEGIIFADGADDELEVTDVPTKVLENLEIIRLEYGERRRVLAKKMKRANTLMKRLRPPEEGDEGPSPLLSVLSGGLAKLSEEQEALDLSERVHDEAARIWGEHGYTFDPTRADDFFEQLMRSGQRPHVRLGGRGGVGGFKRLPQGPQGSEGDEP